MGIYHARYVAERMYLLTEKIVITDFIYEQAGEVCFKCVCCNKVNTIAFAYWDSNVGFLCISCLKKAVEIMEGKK